MMDRGIPVGKPPARNRREVLLCTTLCITLWYNESMSDIEPIRFSAQVFKVQTTIDGGIRLTLDINADAQTTTELIGARQPGIMLECACLMIKPLETIKQIDESINKRELTRNPLYAKQ